MKRENKWVGGEKKQAKIENNATKEKEKRVLQTKLKAKIYGKIE